MPAWWEKCVFTFPGPKVRAWREPLGSNPRCT